MKNRFKKYLFCFLFLTATALYAASGFVVRHIEIQGLHGISSSTVLSYMPINIGDRLDTAKSNEIIEALYETGFFENILLSKRVNTLVVKVKQRPIISQLKITGNKVITSDNLYKGLKTLGFVEGRVYDQSVLENIRKSLEHEYFVQGRYDAKVTINVKKINNYQVVVAINIDEGKVAKIQKIEIIGNQAFSENALLKQFKLSPSNLFSFFTHNDQYSKERLAADLESLRSFYMDRGYIRFKILSHQVTIDSARQHVYIVVRIQEGGQYKVKTWKVSGQLILPKDQIEKLITIKSGDIFSRQDVMTTVKSIQDALGDKGYGNANVTALPTIDDQTKQVSLNFQINPGRRIYIRKIIFSGNYRTNDETFRRNLEIQEGSMLSTTKVQKSKRFLMLLRYVSNVDVSTEPVPGKPDQVDLHYNITERGAATIGGGIGYSVLDKFIVHGELNHPNVFGTGNSLSVGVMKSRSLLSGNIDYYNPFYTKSGIGRDISLYANKFNSEKANITDYAMNSYGASLGYNFRIAENDYLNASAGYENDVLKIGDMPSKELKRFVDQYQRHFYQMILTAGWTHQGLDRAIFPTQGFLQDLGLTVSVPLSSKHSLEYYKLNYDGMYYHPLYKQFIGQLGFHAGYGEGYDRFTRLPIIKNFYAGGIGSVRGYDGNTLGPKDSNRDALGGNAVMDGSVGLIFPNPLGQNVRTTWFFDFGNVYNKPSLAVKTSTGLEVDWLSPVGMLNFVLAKAINANNKKDDTRIFDFAIGASL